MALYPLSTVPAAVAAWISPSQLEMVKSFLIFQALIKAKGFDDLPSLLRQLDREEN